MKYPTYPSNRKIERDRHGHARAVYESTLPPELLREIKQNALTVPLFTLWRNGIYNAFDCDCGRTPDTHHRPNCASTPIYKQMVEDHGNPWLIYRQFPLF